MRNWHWSWLLMLFPGLLYAQEGWILKEVRIVSPVENKVSDPVNIRISDGRIQAIEPYTAAALLAEPGTVVEGRGGFVMAGMIDAHMHHFQSGSLYTRPDALDLRSIKPYPTELAETWSGLPEMWARYLRAGITRICDVGGPRQNFTLSAQADSLPSPDLYVAGPLISSYQPAALRTNDPPILLIKTAEAARAEVERQLAAKPDFVKIWYIVFPGQNPETYLPVVKEAIKVSHAAGISVAVHATQLETARLAVEAGANILVHSVEDKVVDDAFVNLLKAKDVSCIPTLQVSGNYGKAFAG
ncbi:MAG: amidohydrolase family protein, partial [Bacteroidota bacterium]